MSLLDLDLIWAAEDPGEATEDAGALAGGGTAGDDNILGDNTGPQSTPAPTGSADTIDTGAGTDTVDGQNGNDVIFGSSGIDTLSGGNGDDTINGGSGDDTIDGGNGLDTLYGGSGADSVNGGTQADIIYGGSGDDTLNGNQNDDIIYGGSGDDTLDGANEDDVLAGGKGDDTLTGGADDGALGGDTFVFRFELDASSDEVTNTVWFRSNEAGDGTSTPSTNADYMAWNNYMKQLAEWRAGMEAAHGTDENAGNNVGDVTIKVSGGTAKKPTTETYYFAPADASFSWTDSVSTLAIAKSEGNDKILDLGAGDGTDTLRFEGMTSVQFNTLLGSGDIVIANGDYDAQADGVDWQITWNGGSITLLDASGIVVQADLVSLINFDTL